LEISIGQFLNYNYDENINPYSFQETPLFLDYKTLDNKASELHTPICEDNSWIEDYNMAQPRPLNLVTLPQYNGQVGLDPDYYLNSLCGTAIGSDNGHRVRDTNCGLGLTDQNKTID